MTIEEILISLRAKIGIPGRTIVSPPVTETDIRRWAIAVYWPEVPPREFWDAEIAAATRWGGIIAPAEFNPFAWPIDPSERQVRFLDPGPLGAILNGGSEVEYGVPIRPGDVLTSVSTPVEVFERQGRRGPMVFYVAENRWTNQRGEIVKIARSTQIIS